VTRLTEIRLENIRCHPELGTALEPCDWVVLAGANGSGKTSIMEGIYCAARGRSFRSAASAEAIRQGTDLARILLRAQAETPHVLGMSLQARQRMVHLDGAPADLTTIAQAVPVEYLGGDSVRLVQGTPAIRRRFMDWALFHVEPQFLFLWRHWYRAHRQRNALLKARASSTELAPWTDAVVSYGEAVSRLRAGLVKRLEERFSAMDRPPVLRSLDVQFRRGWREASLREALRQSAAREGQAGRAVVGPQYDDWLLAGDGATASGLSRGQAKLASLMLYRCQAAIMREAGRSPVLLIDDIAADLDSGALEAALRLWADSGLQIWLSMLEEDIGLELPGTALRFHVKPGALFPAGGACEKRTQT